MNTALSGKNIMDLMNNNCKILTYGELANYDDIFDAIGESGNLILLYQTRQSYGHWCALFTTPRNTIEFFDSYGTLPDDELLLIDPYFRLISNQNLPHLTALLYDSDMRIEYNNHELQGKGKDIATCGLWAVLRVLTKNMHIDSFNKLIKDLASDFNLSNDELIVNLI